MFMLVQNRQEMMQVHAHHHRFLLLFVCLCCTGRFHTAHVRQFIPDWRFERRRRASLNFRTR